jgi:hypothetical protein
MIRSPLVRLLTETRLLFGRSRILVLSSNFASRRRRFSQTYRCANKFWSHTMELRLRSNHQVRLMITFRLAQSDAGVCIVALLALFGSSSSGYGQQTTGQLLISSGFNPIAATTPAMTTRLMSLPPNQFVLRYKGSRPYYIYADPSACTCAYVGSAVAMDQYRASYGILPADTLSLGGVTNPEQNMINSMDNDDASAQFDNDVFGSQF